MENCATAYPTVQLQTPTFKQGKAIRNDMTTAYHDIVTTYFIYIPSPTCC